MSRNAEALVHQFFDALKSRDGAAIENLLSEDAVHDTPDGKRVVGRPAVRDAISFALLSKKEDRSDIVIMSASDGQRAAAEFTLRIAGAGATVGVIVFELEDGKIARISEYRR